MQHLSEILVLGRNYARKLSTYSLIPVETRHKFSPFLFLQKCVFHCAFLRQDPHRSSPAFDSWSCTMFGNTMGISSPIRCIKLKGGGHFVTKFAAWHLVALNISTYSEHSVTAESHCIHHSPLKLTANLANFLSKLICLVWRCISTFHDKIVGVYILVKPKSAKKGFKSTDNQLGLGPEGLLLWLPSCSRSVR